jgi:hypothetical protein
VRVQVLDVRKVRADVALVVDELVAAAMERRLVTPGSRGCGRPPSRLDADHSTPSSVVNRPSDCSCAVVAAVSRHSGLETRKQFAWWLAKSQAAKSRACR